MRNVGLLALAVIGLGGLVVPSHASAAAADAEPEGPVIRYTIVPNHPVDPAFWLPVTPRIALWADGRFVAFDPGLRRGEWLLPQLVEGDVEPSTVSDLVARADADGLLDDGGDYGLMLDYGLHAPMTEVVLRDGGAEWVHTAFALDLRASETGDRRVLADFVTDVVSLQTSDTVEVTPWVPDAIANRAAAVSTGDTNGAAVEWPESGPTLRGDGDCLVVRDPTSIAVVRDALASTRFVNGGQEWRLVARAVLPGVPPC